MKKLIESLSPLERKILPFVKEGDVEKMCQKSRLDRTSVVRALDFLSNKKIVDLTTKEETWIELGENGLLYVKKGLPERRLVNFIAEKKSVSLKDAQKSAGLDDNEFKISIGVLKKKALLVLKEGNLLFTGTKEEIAGKTLEEKFLENLPKKTSELNSEEKYSLENLKSRKQIIEIAVKKNMFVNINSLGEQLLKENLGKDELLEALTPELLQSNAWKEKKFRRYDITARVPKIQGGKRHFVNQAIEYAKKIWLELGFKEMTGSLVQSSFWNFDALFTAQDHPVREMQDTFFIKDTQATLSDKKILQEVKNAHEGNIKGSKGWQYSWKEEDARKVVLRTHTTCLSVQTLKKIAEAKEFPAKYFALGKCFRNETVDWNHGFEFNQTEGIVVDEHANFKQLLGYLTEFFQKMGYKKIRIRPGYFPYTEPSLEIDVYHPVHKKWVELGGAGMFRPEVTIPIFGKHIPVLAWGPGFDRIIMEFFKITDLRDMYKNDINKLREMKIWRR